MGTMIWTKLYLHYLECFYTSFIVSRQNGLKNISYRFLKNIYAYERIEPSIVVPTLPTKYLAWIFLNLHYIRMFHTSYSFSAKWVWEDYLKMSTNFQLFLITPLPIKEKVFLHFNKLESHSPWNALGKVWLKLTQWV